MTLLIAFIVGLVYLTVDTFLDCRRYEKRERPRHHGGRRLR